MIVVEGLDNTGKTTLVDQLRAAFPELGHHPSIGNKHDIKVIHDQAWQWLLDDQKNPRVIVDRSRFISEYIYNPILRRRELAFGQGEWFDMLKDFFSRPQMIVYCQRPLEEIRDDFEEREQLEGIYERLYELDRAYYRFMQFVQFMAHLDRGKKILFTTYNFAIEENYESICFWVERYLDKVKEDV